MRRLRRSLRSPALPDAAGLGLIGFLLGVASPSGVAQDAPPRSVMMQDLTVPPDRLPNGCSLKVIEPARQEVVSTSGAGRQTIRFIGPTPSMQPTGITTNPWIGTDRKVLGWLRGNVTGLGRLRVPDAPPSLSEESALKSQLADGVDEGYAATYGQTGAQDLGVHAVRFAVEPESRLDFSEKAVKNTSHVEIGSTSILFYGDDGRCATAIESYLKALSK